MKQYRGVVVPMVTPVTKKGNLDANAVERIVNFFAEAGVSPLLMGTTGEGNSVSRKDGLLFVETAVQAAAKRITIYAGLTGNCFSEQLEQAEAYFNEHGKVSTFVGRFIPAIRQLISIPAGLSKMHFGWFLFYTFLGAGIWNTILAVLGYVAHGQADLINQYSHELSVAILILLGAVILYFVLKKFVFKKK